MRRSVIPNLYPYIFVIFPALSLYIHNVQQLRPQEIVQVILFTLACALLFRWGSTKLIKDHSKSDIITAIFFILFFSFGHVKRAASYLFNSIGALAYTQFLFNGKLADFFWLVIWFGAFIIFTLVILKYRKRLVYANQMLNITSILLILTVSIEWTLSVYSQPNDNIKSFINSWTSESPYKNINLGNIAQNRLPDIYYIILDGFGSQNLLENYYQADLSKFFTYLDQEGFYIAYRSRSNYAWTELSLTSSLNFTYLDELSLLGADTSDTLPLEVMVEKNRLFDVFREYGYRIVTFSDEYTMTDITSADVYLAPQRWVLNAFQNELINTTPLPALQRVLSLKSAFDFHRDHILFMFENLMISGDYSQPRFVFAHFMAPHPPFVFDADGNSSPNEGTFTFNYIDAALDKAGRESFISGYRNQAIFMANRLIPELEKILHNSTRPVIVIIQGDHGPGLYLDWTSVENTDLYERMSILNAYYFFDRNYQRLTDDITPVNSFRVIQSQYFGIDVPLLENKNYFTLVYHPYDFIDVTDKLSTRGEH
jgi:hypothetical protein